MLTASVGYVPLLLGASGVEHLLGRMTHGGGRLHTCRVESMSLVVWLLRSGLGSWFAEVLWGRGPLLGSLEPKLGCTCCCGVVVGS
jgi:hypothetical protein